MPPQPVEWILVIFYGPEAHRATYGRQVKSNRYTKDFIQLSRKPEFLAIISRLFPVPSGTNSFPLTYCWPAGSTSGHLVFESGDRPHLKWGTSLGAPQAWKMTPAPTATTTETMPGDPSLEDFDAAEQEFAQLSTRGAGQPYLLAVKLRDEPSRLHLRVYLKRPAEAFTWADIARIPEEIQDLASRTKQTRALAWAHLPSGGVYPSTSISESLSIISASGDPLSAVNALDPAAARALTSYLRQPGYGLFFDPSRNHDAWFKPSPLPAALASAAGELVGALDARLPPLPDGDSAAEALDGDDEEAAAFRDDIAEGRYAVPDAKVTAKTRGSAQKAFAEKVKANYGYRCALTGIQTREFLVAAHIVPWSKDASIRLDPANGICLSLVVDRAFEAGFIVIHDDFTVHINRTKIGDDMALLNQLEVFHGERLRVPAKGPPNVAYLRRRRAIVASAE